jgi:hypothetical protein
MTFRLLIFNLFCICSSYLSEEWLSIDVIIAPLVLWWIICMIHLLWHKWNHVLLKRFLVEVGSWCLIHLWLVIVLGIIIGRWFGHLWLELLYISHIKLTIIIQLLCVFFKIVFFLNFLQVLLVVLVISLFKACETWALWRSATIACLQISPKALSTWIFVDLIVP